MRRLDLRGFLLLVVSACVSIGPGAWMAGAADDDPVYVPSAPTPRIEVGDVQEPRAGSAGSGSASPAKLQNSLRDIESAITSAKQAVESLEKEKNALTSQLASVQGELAASRLDARAIESKLTRQVDTLQNSLRAAEERGGTLEKSVAELERERASLTTRLSAAQTDLTSAREQLNAAEEAKAAATRQLGQTQDELTGAKTEISEIKIKRNEMEDLKRVMTKAQKDLDQAVGERTQLKSSLQTTQDELKRRTADLEAARKTLAETTDRDAQTLQKEIAAREKTITQLKAQVADDGQRLAQRDDQLAKLREVHATLDKQYMTLEASSKDAEAKLGTLEQGRTTLSDQLAKAQKTLGETQNTLKETESKLAKAAQELEGLKGEKTALTGQLAKVQQSLDDYQKKESRMTVEMEDAKFRTQEFAKEMDALRNTQIELEGRLAATRDENAKKVVSLQQELETKHKELAQLKQAVAAGDQGRLDLQDQLRVAKDSHEAFNQQLKSLQAGQSDRDVLQAQLNDKETQIAKMKSELSSLSHQLEVANEDLKSASAQGQENKQQLSIDRQGLEWRVESLESELKESRAAEARLQLQLEDAHGDQHTGQEFRQQMVDKLAEREAQLRQAESVIQLLQGQGGAATPPAIPSVSTFTPAQEPSGSSSSSLDHLTGAASEPSVTWVSGATSSDSSSQALASSDRYPVKVYQVNDELNFLVFSMEGMGWAKTGTQLLLLADDEPIVSVQLTELDGEGFAVAQITKVLDQSRQIRKGDFLFARPLMPVMGQ